MHGAHVKRVHHPSLQKNMKAFDECFFAAPDDSSLPMGTRHVLFKERLDVNDHTDAKFCSKRMRFRRDTAAEVETCMSLALQHQKFLKGRH
jgi:hypothetical protein